ncbi:MAG: hypothetical protein HY682_02510 [Chloroflexi bacterium]|nr:hypothetical protein [Chloroflexota bacterium]
MYRQESLEHAPVQFAAADEARAAAHAASSAVGGVRRILAAIVEPFGSLGQIESLDPAVRARLSAREKALTDANLHCL